MGAEISVQTAELSVCIRKTLINGQKDIREKCVCFRGLSMMRTLLYPVISNHPSFQERSRSTFLLICDPGNECKIFTFEVSSVSECLCLFSEADHV